MDKVRFEDPLKFLYVIGFNPFVDDMFSKFRKCFCSFVVIITLTLSFLELILNFHGLESFSRASESMIVLYQVIFKMAVLVIYQKQIVYVLEESSKFWSLDTFDYSSKIKCVHRVLQKFYFVYKLLMVLMSVQFISRKIIFKSNKPLTMAYGESRGLTPTVDFMYFILHSCGTFIAFNLVLGFDGLFCYLIAHVLSELEMVKTGFAVFEENNSDEFFVVIKHHQTIVKYIQQLNQIYSNILLHQHISCLFGICFGLFLLSKDGVPPSFEHVTKFVPYIISFATQTFAFCFIGSLIISWSSQVTDTLFYHGWNEKSYKYKVEKLIVINRGQKAAKLTLGGFGKLDLESFTLVIKNAFSFFTFINTIQEK